MRMKMMGGGAAVFFTLWLVAVFVSGVVAGEFVLGVAVTTSVTFTSSVNLSVSNSSLTVAAPGSVNTYALSNLTAAYSVPITFSESVGLFNVSVLQNESEGCFAFWNETVSNQTAYLERVIREQLVPSQNQFEQQRQLLADSVVSCDAEKNILRNEITNGVIQLNSTRTNYESVVQRQGAEIGKLKGEKKLYFWWNLGLIAAVVLLFVGSAKNVTFKTLFDEVANMRGRRQTSGFYQKPLRQRGVKK